MMTREEAQKILDAGNEIAIRKFQQMSAEIDRLMALSPDPRQPPLGKNRFS